MGEKWNTEVERVADVGKWTDVFKGDSRAQTFPEFHGWDLAQAAGECDASSVDPVLQFDWPAAQFRDEEYCYTGSIYVRITSCPTAECEIDQLILSCSVAYIVKADKTCDGLIKCERFKGSRNNKLDMAYRQKPGDEPGVLAAPDRWFRDVCEDGKEGW